MSSPHLFHITTVCPKVQISINQLNDRLIIFLVNTSDKILKKFKSIPTTELLLRV